MRTPRAPMPQPEPEAKHFICLVYAGVRNAKKPKHFHLYYQVGDDWETSPVLGGQRTFKKRIGSGSVGLVHRMERAAPDGTDGLRVYAACASVKGAWRSVDDVVKWQAKHATAQAEVAAWEQRRGETANLIREQLKPLKEAMHGLTRNERAVFLAMVLTELQSGTVMYF